MKRSKFSEAQVAMILRQTADRGAPFGPGDSLTIRIFQLSALVSRGAPKTVSLSF